MLHRVLLLLLFLLTGCAASVIPAWEAARDRALQDPGPAPPQWEPDAVLLMSEALVDDALGVLLAEQGNLRGEIAAGPITAVPDLSVRQVDLKAAKCERCLRVRAELDGVITVRSLLGEVEAPVQAVLRFDAVFDVVQADEVWSLTVAPKKLHQVEIDLAGADLAAFVQPVRAWLEEAFIDQPPIPLAELGSTDLPIRAMRVVPVRRDLRVDLLTTTVQTDPLRTDAGLIERRADAKDGRAWQLWITPAGREALAETRNGLAELNARLTEGFTDAEIDVVARWLASLQTKFPNGDEQ